MKDVHIPDPCGEEWDEMDGTARQRYCEVCARTITDLSDMTREEAHAFMDEAEAMGVTPCITYIVDTHTNTLSFAQPPPSATQRRLATLSATLSLPLLLAACHASDQDVSAHHASANAPILIQDGATPSLRDTTPTPGSGRAPTRARRTPDARAEYHKFVERMRRLQRERDELAYRRAHTIVVREESLRHRRRLGKRLRPTPIIASEQ